MKKAFSGLLLPIVRQGKIVADSVYLGLLTQSIDGIEQKGILRYILHGRVVPPFCMAPPRIVCMLSRHSRLMRSMHTIRVSTVLVCCDTSRPPRTSTSSRSHCHSLSSSATLSLRTSATPLPISCLPYIPLRPVCLPICCLPVYAFRSATAQMLSPMSS